MEEIADRCMIHLPASTIELAKALDESPENIEKALKDDGRVNPPLNREKGVWIPSGATMKVMCDSSDFFDGARFVPKRLADVITERYMFKTTRDNKTIFFYDGPSGIWKDNGSDVIETSSARLLGEESTTHRHKEAVGYIACTTYTDRKDFDSDPYKIALENGVYDVKTMKFMEHGPQYLLTSAMPFEYKKDAKCPNFHKFLKEVVRESDIPVIQELFGYCLVRNYNFKKMAMFIGGGDNGKSALLNTLKMFLGNGNTVSLSLQELASDKFARAGLYGKLANIFNDLDDKAVSKTGWIKTLTGGDPIEARTLFKGYFNFTNYAKLIFSCNKFPMSNDNTDAYVDRWLFVDFPNKFTGDNVKPMQELLDTFEAELPGIFNWSLEGIKKVYKQNGFSNKASTEDKREMIIRMSDPLGAFVMDMVEEDPESFVLKKDFYQEYAGYCRQHKISALSIDVFGKNLLKHLRVQSVQKRINGKVERIWKGIRLIKIEETDKKKATEQTEMGDHNG